MGWGAGKASKLKSSKSSASGIGRPMVADGGRAKASIHHDSQSNDDVGSGKGSETVCFLGAQSEHRGFLTAGSTELDSDKRLFREGGGGEETSWDEMCGGESEWEVFLGDGDLNNTKCDSMRCRMRDATHGRRLRGRGGTEWGSDGTSEQDRFRFREGWEASPSLSSESIEYVSEGATDGLREGNEYRVVSTVLGGDGV